MNKLQRAHLRPLKTLFHCSRFTLQTATCPQPLIRLCTNELFGFLFYHLNLRVIYETSSIEEDVRCYFDKLELKLCMDKLDNHEHRSKISAKKCSFITQIQVSANLFINKSKPSTQTNKNRFVIFSTQYVERRKVYRTEFR